MPLIIGTKLGPYEILGPAETSTGNFHAMFLQNFFDEVRRKVPVGK